MGSFKRALLGYRREDVEAAIASRDARIWSLQDEAAAAAEAAARADRELADLSAMVLEREREIRGLEQRLREAEERHERSIGSLQSVAARLDEIQAQARGQATRIRMKALREAVEVSRRAEELAGADATPAETPTAIGGAAQPLEGPVRVEVGPLGDFSQLIEIEEAIGRLGAAEISVERFSEGRATLSMRLDQPVDLLGELEAGAGADFAVRRLADEEQTRGADGDSGPEQQAA